MIKKKKSKKYCKTCDWLAEFEGICCNADCEYCATNPSLSLWDGERDCECWKKKRKVGKKK